MCQDTKTGLCDDIRMKGEDEKTPGNTAYPVDVAERNIANNVQMIDAAKKKRVLIFTKQFIIHEHLKHNYKDKTPVHTLAFIASFAQKPVTHRHLTRGQAPHG